jgi:hypothetical protein
MDYFVTMSFKFPNKEFYIKDTYDSLEWFETTITKPTDEELQQYWQEIQFEYFIGIMVKQRNMLLISSDFRALPDFPNRDQWLSYRQQLRDLPLNWTIDTPFPKPPE